MIALTRFIKTAGLSPRVRGNQLSPLLFYQFQWSIPARAGEPEDSLIVAVRFTVYPRACGGTRA